MKATIEFPDWIDEDKFEYVGFGYPDNDQMGIKWLDDKEWFLHWDVATPPRLFCFKKKKKFVWPEFIKGSITLCYYKETQNRRGGWRFCDGVTLDIELLNEFLKEPIDTSTLDKDKAYIKGGLI